MNDEIQMTKSRGNPTTEARRDSAAGGVHACGARGRGAPRSAPGPSRPFRIFSFGFPSSFGLRHSSFPLRAAFTLIEMLVVIAVITILAAMIFPITRAVNRTKVRSRAQAELTQIESAIELYKAKHGFYPPDNPVT